MLGCMWEGCWGEKLHPLSLQNVTRGQLWPALSLVLKNKCTWPRTIWCVSFHFSFIPDYLNTLIIPATLFPFLFSLLLGPQVKWWLKSFLGEVLNMSCCASGLNCLEGAPQSPGFWDPSLSLPLCARKLLPSRRIGENRGSHSGSPPRAL